MIIQILLDVASLWVSGAITLLPDLPASYWSMIGQYEAGVSWIIDRAVIWGFIVPFNTIVMCLAWWGWYLGLYVAVALIRLVLWMMGR